MLLKVKAIQFRTLPKRNSLFIKTKKVLNYLSDITSKEWGEPEKYSRVLSIYMYWAYC